MNSFDYDDPGQDDARRIDADLKANRIELVAALAGVLWIPLAIALEAGWGWGLVGASVIALVAQTARQWVELPLQPSWVFGGSALAIGGLWTLTSPQLAVIPLITFLVGGALLGAGVIRHHLPPRGHGV